MLAQGAIDIKRNNQGLSPTFSNMKKKIIVHLI